MAVQSDIHDFVARIVGIENIAAASDLNKHHGVDGDDFFELIDEFSKEFSVDVSDYLWYFHHREEGFGLGGLFFRTPDQRVPHIPVSIMTLHDAANAGRWTVDYPYHQLPDSRPDLFMNRVIFVVVALLALFFGFGTSSA